jgi:hypothetical protein
MAAQALLSAPELQQILRCLDEGNPLVYYRKPDETFALHALADPAEVVLGRRPDCGIALSWDQSVSRVHAVLSLIGAEWVITDEGLSHNGTFVNGDRVKGPRRLRDGDAILVGSVLLTFRAPQLTNAGRTATSVAGPSRIVLTAGQRRVLAAMCRPLADGGDGAGPASNKQIAEELYISVETVKTHMRTLAQLFSVDHLPQYERRYAMARDAIRWGLNTEQ